MSWQGPPGWRQTTLTDRADGRGPVMLRPMTVGDLLDDPFVVLRHNLRTLLLVTAAVVIPTQIVTSFLQRGSMGGLGFMDMFNDPMAAQVAFEAGDTGALTAIGVSILAAATVLPLVNGVVSRVGVSAALGEQLTAGEALRAGLRRWPALIATWFAASAATFGPAILAFGLLVTGQPALAVVGGLVLLAAIPVGVAAWVLFFPVVAVVVVEQASPIAALRRSVGLVRPRFFPVLGAVLLAMLVAGLVQSALAGIPSAGAMFIGLEAGWILLAFGGIAAELIVTPYRALVAAFIYLDGRVRTEALDLLVAADTGAGALRGS